MTQCTIWEGYFTGNGYGQIKLNGVKWAAHRLAYVNAKGAIPDGMVVRHTCDNRKCVNPEHLILGTQHDNVMDCVIRGRHSKAKLSANQVLAIRRDQRSSRRIAPEYNVSDSTIKFIKARKSYKHIQEEIL